MTQHFPLSRRLRGALAPALVALVAGCESHPLAPRLAPVPKPGLPPATPIQLATVACHADRVARTVRCGDDAGLPADSGARIIIGGQNQYVRLTASNSDYNPGGELLTFDVTVRNLIPQTLGTSDGATLDPNGVRIFLVEEPTVTEGTGVVSVASADGYETFTAGNQPYYQYNTMLPEFAVSAPRTWSMNLPTTVTKFVFYVYVSAPVPFPAGYVLLQSGNNKMRSDATRLVVATSKSAVGNTVAGTTFSWMVSDVSLASVDPDGTVHGIRDGGITVTATDNAGRVGTFGLTITPIRRFWNAGASTTDYFTNGNWTLNVVPTSQDTVEVATNPGSVYPALTANATAGGLWVRDGASLNLGAFNYTLTSNTRLDGLSAVTATSGTLFFSGPATTLTLVSGIGGLPKLPPTRITSTGRVTASGSLTVLRRLRVDGGRLSNGNSNRIRVENTP